jgi:hypothetical protein
MVPTDFPLIHTDAYESGSLVSLSMTFPETVIFWAWAMAGKKKIITAKRKHFIMNWSMNRCLKYNVLDTTPLHGEIC